MNGDTFQWKQRRNKTEKKTQKRLTKSSRKEHVVERKKHVSHLIYKLDMNVKMMFDSFIQSIKNVAHVMSSMGLSIQFNPQFMCYTRHTLIISFDASMPTVSTVN